MEEPARNLVSPKGCDRARVGDGTVSGEQGDGVDFRRCGDDAVEWVAVWKIEFEGEACDFRADRNHTKTFGHLGEQGINAVCVFDPPFGAEIRDL